MLDVLKSLIQDEEGQGMAEYGLVLGVLAVGVVAVIAVFRLNVEDLFKKQTEKIVEVIISI